MLCLIVFEWVAGLLLCRNEPWYSCVCRSHEPSPQLDFAVNTASNVMTFTLVVMLVAFAVCSQHRARSLFSELPWTNRTAMVCSVVVLALQVRFCRFYVAFDAHDYQSNPACALRHILHSFSSVFVTNVTALHLVSLRLTFQITFG